MLNFSNQANIYVYTDVTDMRKVLTAYQELCGKHFSPIRPIAVFLFLSIVDAIE